MNRVVPFAMEFVRFQVDISKLFIRDQAVALGAPPAADGSHGECAHVVVRAFMRVPLIRH